MKKRLFKLSALCLTLAVSLQFFSGAAASLAGEDAETKISLQEEELTEVVSLRTRSTKNFEKVEGYYFSAIYNEPVHFLNDEGEWEEIDNTLTPVMAAPSNGPTVRPYLNSEIGYMENKANDFKVRLPNTISAQKPVFVNYAGYSLSFHMEEASSSRMQIAPVESVAQLRSRVEREVAAIADTEKQEELRMQAMTAVANQTAGVSYESVMSAVDVNYEISGQKLKESLILDSKPAQNSFSFSLSYTGLVPVVQEFGAVHFYARGNENGEDSEPVFIMEAPYMFDSGDSLTMDIAVEVTPTATGCTYTITPDEEWLSAPDRVYPVTIDPTITTSTNSADIQDNGVNQSNPTTNYMTVDRMYVGSNLAGTAAQESRIYIRFPLPTSVTYTSLIMSAYMYLDHHETASYQTAVQNIIDIYEVPLSYNWNSSTITWNSQAGYTFTNLIDSDKTDKSYSVESFNITSLVKKWYSMTTPNNGLVIKPRTLDKTKTNRTCFISSDIGSAKAAKRPRIVIEYFNGVPTYGITDGGVYYLRNVNSNRYLDISSIGQGNLAVQRLYDFKKETYQQWKVKYCGGGLYEFIPLNYSNYRLSNRTSLQFVGQPIVMYTKQADTRTEYFQIIDNLDGSFRIKQAISDAQVMTVKNDSKTDNSGMQTETWSNKNSQKWFFEVAPNYGCAGGFRDITDTSINCMGYALFINKDITLSLPGSEHKTTFYRSQIESTLKAQVGENGYRYIYNYQTPIEANEYRIAIRTPNYLDGIHRFHVIYQLSDGRWAGKDDQSCSHWFEPGDPSVTGEMWSNNAYAESAGTLYYAIKKKN